MAGFVLDAIFPLEFFCALSVCVRALFLSSNLTSEMILSTRLLGQPLDVRRVLNI